MHFSEKAIPECIINNIPECISIINNKIAGHAFMKDAETSFIKRFHD